MNIRPVQQHNTNFEALNAPKTLRFFHDNMSGNALLNNPQIRACAEKFDVNVEPLRRSSYAYLYGLRGVKHCRKKDIVTPVYEINGRYSISQVNNLVGAIETQLREILMRVVAEHYPENGVFKSKDILKIFEAAEVKDNFTPEEALRYSFEQNGKSTLLTKFFEINPVDDNEKDYNKVISIMKSNSKIDFNQKDCVGISVLENIMNFENSKGLDLVLDTEFDYSPELDKLFSNIKNEDFKKKASGVKIKFPDFEAIYKQGFSDESLAFLNSPFCDSKNKSVTILMKSLSGYIGSAQQRLHKKLYNYLPEYYRNHYSRKIGSRCSIINQEEVVQGRFIAPKQLELADAVVPAGKLLENFAIKECVQKYSVVVKQGAQNGVVKKKVKRFLPFLPPKIVEEPGYEYILTGVKKGKEDIKTQEHLILVSDGLDFYIGNLVEEIQQKDLERFINTVSQKHPDKTAFTAKELFDILESEEIKGNYTRKEALTNRINAENDETLLNKFFDLKETEEILEDYYYDRLVSIIRSTPGLDFKRTSILEKVLTLENPKALDLIKEEEFEPSKRLDRIFNNIKDEKFKAKVRQLKFKFPDAVERLKNDRDLNFYGQSAFSYLESPFCDSKKEAIRIWTELKTRFDTETCLKINAMLYKYLPENLRIQG